MKKILFCAAVAALAAACTSEEDLVLSQETTAKGLTFDVSLAENAVTKGELWKDENGTYPFFWYAEQDRINVIALNALAATTSGVGYGDNSSSKGVATQASGTWAFTDGAATYKATKSENYGLFTAIDDANMLALPAYDATSAATKANTTATIVATYGFTAKTVKSDLD